ncbi:hypothetical protein EV126DRAFT_125161 [Verticillium dahliae]|nr:hypothetical protein EV126DRAFT_125161 [Verticillium dahliae]
MSIVGGTKVPTSQLCLPITHSVSYVQGPSPPPRPPAAAPAAPAPPPYSSSSDPKPTSHPFQQEKKKRTTSLSFRSLVSSHHWTAAYSLCPSCRVCQQPQHPTHSLALNPYLAASSPRTRSLIVRFVPPGSSCLGSVPSSRPPTTHQLHTFLVWPP